MAAIAVAGVGLMVVCSSSVAAAMMMGGDGDDDSSEWSCLPKPQKPQWYQPSQVVSM